MTNRFIRISNLRCGAAVFAVVLATSFASPAAEATIAPQTADPAIARAIEQIGDLHRKGGISAADGELALAYYIRLSNRRGRILAAIPPEQLIPVTGAQLSPDRRQAARYYQIAGRLGSPDALLRLGELYLSGDLISGDAEKAFDYFQQAAALGSETASVNIGLMMIRGTGTARDESGGMGLLFEAAENGNAQALIALGDIYRFGEGEGIEPDSQRSFTFYQRAADKGNTQALLNVARMMIDGEGVPAKPDKGYEMANRLYVKGEPGALLLMGDLYLGGIAGVLRPDSKKAYEVFAAARDAGSATGRLQTALMQVHGQGVPQNVEAGLRILREMAENGDASAAFKLGQLHEHGLADALSPDPAKAFAFYETAAAAGHVGSKVRAAKLMIEGSGTSANAAAGVAILEKLAEQRLSDAYLMLGEYYSGSLVDGAEDLSRAFGFYRRAADANSMTGKIQTALMMLRGEGTEMDRAAGLGLLQEAAASGNWDALIALGSVHLSGEAGKTDAEAAIAAFEAASEQGAAKANILLGDLYSNGKTIPPDGELAIYYYKKAAGIDPDKSGSSTGINP